MVCHRSDTKALTCDLQQCTNGALRAGKGEASATPAPFTLEVLNYEKQFRIV